MTENNAENGQQNAQNGPQNVVIDDATIQRIAEATSRQAGQNVNNPPVNNGAQSNDQNNGAQGNNSGQNANQSGDVLAAIQALPEQLVNSIREAFPAGNGGGSNDAGSNNGGGESGGNGTGSNENSGAGAAQQTAAPGQKKSFGEWWFGK